MLSGRGVARYVYANPPVAPLVSADGTGYTNSRSIGGFTQVGLYFNIDGEEYRTNSNGTQAASSQGTWLDQGTSDQVWIEFTRTGGSATQWVGFSNSTRYQLDVTRKFYIEDVTIGGTNETISGSFSFYDAASGGNLLDSTTTQTWTADFTEGCPMCCFTPDTLITMADNSKMPIVEVQAGDLIKVHDGVERVSEIITRTNRVMYLIRFANGKLLEASEDHPLYVDGKGYAAVNPDPNIEYKDLGVAKHLLVGDKVLDENGKLNRITDISVIHYPETVYTFGNSKFYANGMLVY